MAAFPGALETSRRRWLSRVDLPLLGSALALIVMGLMSLYSVSEGGFYFRRQLLNLAVGLVPFAVFAFVNPIWWRRAAKWLYGLNVLMLAAVLVAGKTTKGAQRWIDLGPFQFQPSEAAKLLIVLTLAAFYASRIDDIRKPSTFFLGLLHVAIPAFLVFRQPHLGATLVLLVIWFAISLVAGVRLRYLGGSVLLVVVLALLATKVPAISDRLLRDYQRERIPTRSAQRDLRGSDYQTWRAEIAFGVGGVTGAGFMRGQQKDGRFVPEQHNDFILTVIGEEGGLLGVSLLILAYGVFFWRIFVAMWQSSEPYFRMAAAGIFAMLGFHTVVNTYMVVQLLPVVGLWLPFMSYGGTALWLCMACLGLLLSIRARQRPILFN